MSRRKNTATAFTVWCVALLSVLAAVTAIAVPVLGAGGGGTGGGASSRDLTYGDWNVTSSEKHEGKNISVSGNITVSGRLELYNGTLTFNIGGGEVRRITVNGSGNLVIRNMRFAVTDKNGSFHINVSGNGWMDIIGSSISGLKGPSGIAGIEGRAGGLPIMVLATTVIDDAAGTVVSWNGGNCEIDNTTIRMGVEGYRGMVVGNAQATLRNNHIDMTSALGTTIGMSFNGTEDAVTDGNLITNADTAMLVTSSSSIRSTRDHFLNAGTGISLKDSTISFTGLKVDGSDTALDASKSTVIGADSSIVSNGMDVRLAASTTEMANVTYDEAILSSSAMLTRSWHITASVKDIVGQPVEGASVVLASAIGTIKYNGTTGPDGRSGPVLIDAYTEDETGVVSFTPYNLAVSKGALYEDVSIVLDRERSIDVVMGGPDVKVDLVYIVGEPSVDVPFKVHADLSTDSDLTPPMSVVLQDGDSHVGDPIAFDFGGELTGAVEFDWTPSYGGDHVVVVEADPGNTLQNIDTGNNRMTITVHVTDDGNGSVGQPDLTVQGISFDRPAGEITDLEEVKGTVTIQNIGTADAGSFKVCQYVDSNEVECKRFTGLGAGDTTYMTFRWTASTGDHDFEAEVDVDKEVVESNEQNNRADQRTTIGSGDWSDWLCIGVLVIGVIIFVVAIAYSIKKASATRAAQQQQQLHQQPTMQGGQYPSQQFEHTPYGHSSYSYGPPTGPQPPYGPSVQGLPQSPQSPPQPEPYSSYEPPQAEPVQIDHVGSRMAELNIHEGGIPVGALTSEEKDILRSRADDRPRSRPRKVAMARVAGGPTVELLQCPRCGNEDVQPFEQGYRKCRACGKVFFIR